MEFFGTKSHFLVTSDIFATPKLAFAHAPEKVGPTRAAEAAFGN
jgi:hypothetical protein